MNTIVFPSIYDYDLITIENMRNRSATYVIDDIPQVFRSFIIRALVRLHLSKKINRYIPLPFRHVWFILVFKKIGVINDSFTCLFYESNVYANDTRLIGKIRNHIKNIKIIYRLSNPIDKISNVNIVEHIKQFDEVITFDIEDSKKYELTYIQYEYEPKYFLDNLTIPEYDVFFIGNNKGRIKIIHDLYTTLTNKKLRCLFYVNNVQDYEKLSTFNDIVYNEHLSYDRVIQLILKSKSILEIVQDDQSGQSLRFREAWFFKRLLITNVNYTKLYPKISLINSQISANAELIESFHVFEILEDPINLSIDKFLSSI